MIKTQIEIQRETMERASRILSEVPDGVERAAVAAINRGLSKIKTTAFQGIKEVYTVQPKALNSATKTKVKKADKEELAGYVEFSGVKIPLYKFQVTPKKPATGRTVKAQIKRDGGSVYESAFVAAMNQSTGHTGVFRRTEEKRFPIKEYMGLSAAQMAKQEEISEKVQRGAQELANARMEHEIERILNQYGGKSI